MIKQKKGAGSLIKVLVGPGCYMKMYKQDAIKQGLYQETADRRPKAEKITRLDPLENVIDVAEVVQETGLSTKEKAESVQPDNFTEIPGVGKATDKALHKHGIDTLEQLLDCDVSFLNKQGQQAVERWRGSL